MSRPFPAFLLFPSFLFLHIYFPHVIFEPFFPPSAEELKRQTAEMKMQTAALEGAQAELISIQAQLAQAGADMENIRAVATVSENTKQEAIDLVRSQWQEEVASLQAIMKGKAGCLYLHFCDP